MAFDMSWKLQYCTLPRGLPLGEMGANQLVYARSRCPPSKEGNNHQKPSNFHNERFKITYKLGPTKN